MFKTTLLLVSAVSWVAALPFSTDNEGAGYKYGVSHQLGKEDYYNITLDEVTFLLYTRSNRSPGVRIFVNDTEGLQQTDFNPADPIMMSTHGFMSTLDDGEVQKPMNTFLDLTPYNVIAVDWSPCSRILLYEQAVACTPVVGGYIADLLRYLKREKGINFDDVHLVGHSMGAQVLGHAGQNLGDEQVGRITALDPAGPLFEHADPMDRLDPGDAKFVDAIHTFTPFLGMKQTVGHLDFYPNGGKNQPGCGPTSMGCNHGKAVDYFTSTVSEQDRHKYAANLCDRLEDAVAVNCTGPEGYMGYDAINTAPGIYSLHMNEETAEFNTEF